MRTYTIDLTEIDMKQQEIVCNFSFMNKHYRVEQLIFGYLNSFSLELLTYKSVCLNVKLFPAASEIYIDIGQIFWLNSLSNYEDRFWSLLGQRHVQSISTNSRKTPHGSSETTSDDRGGYGQRNRNTRPAKLHIFDCRRSQTTIF